jgi:prepilin-type N-terminal cleavage/methylation domain-containing protein
MEKLQLLRKRRQQQGFTLVETMVAIVVLTVGLMSVAALMSQMVGTSSQSRYMSTAALLASEKLEDLSHYSSKAPPASIAAGGSLGGNVAGFFDTIQISQAAGVISESTSENGVATTISHLPDGTTTAVQGGAAPPNPGAETFVRRWTIAANTPVIGMRQITVLVTMQNTPPNAPVTFQMSSVRP